MVGWFPVRTCDQHRRLLEACDCVDAPLIRLDGITTDTLARLPRGLIALTYSCRLRNRISGSSLVLWK
jgi:hypothetical protein